MVRDPLGVGVDDDDRHAGVGQLRAVGPPDATPAADDHVIAQRGDLLVHPSPVHGRAEVAFDEQLQRDRQRVERGPDAGEDEHDREDLARTVERLDLAEPDRRHRRHRLVERRRATPNPSTHVADGAEDDDTGQRHEPEHDMAGPPGPSDHRRCGRRANAAHPHRRGSYASV